MHTDIRSDGTVDRYVYFPGSFLVLAVLDENNAPKELYTRGPDLSGTLSAAGGIGGILACTYATGPVLYHHADLMGNIIALTDPSGSVASTFRYTPFGQIAGQTGVLVPRCLWASKEVDKSIGIIYYGYRYYLPCLGRWMTRDVLGEQQLVHRYEFVFNTPLDFLDAYGLEGEKIFGHDYKHYLENIVRNRIREYVYNNTAEDDPGRELAIELMEYYVFGGDSYESQKREWKELLQGQKELNQALAEKMLSKAREICYGSAQQGSVRDNIGKVQLEELASLRLTLYGSHCIDIEGVFYARNLGTSCCEVEFSDIKYTWIDKGDLHVGKSTELTGGQVVQDESFSRIASMLSLMFPSTGPFDISISWIDSSVWCVDCELGLVAHQSGWPNFK